MAPAWRKILAISALGVSAATAALRVAAAGTEFQPVGFDELAGYTFTPPPYDPVAAEQGKIETGEEQIPATIKALTGHSVAITGYMVPVRMDKGRVTEFMLMRNTLACCFGGVPNMNEWVVVKLKQPVPATMDTPVTFLGRLKVGAIVENGYVTGLYELEAAQPK